MRSKIGWILAFVLLLAALFLLPSLVMGRWWGGDSYGMMGPGMMGNWGWMGPLGFFGMAFMWLVPVGILALAVAGAVALFSGLFRSANRPAAAERICDNCHKPAQADWSTCPYCGQAL
jgi:hypothetical protein